MEGTAEARPGPARHRSPTSTKRQQPAVVCLSGPLCIRRTPQSRDTWAKESTSLSVIPPPPPHPSPPPPPQPPLLLRCLRLTPPDKPKPFPPCGSVANPARNQSGREPNEITHVCVLQAADQRQGYWNRPQGAVTHGDLGVCVCNYELERRERINRT